MKKIIAANVISGLSLVCLIVFGFKYLEFKNTPIYQDYKIEITNNPVTAGEDIMFAMTGEKMLDCQADHVYGIATNQDGTVEVVLDKFTSMYKRNVKKGQTVTNSWSLHKPAEITPGYWRVDMVGHWSCRMWIFTSMETVRMHDNILLVVE